MTFRVHKSCTFETRSGEKKTRLKKVLCALGDAHCKTRELLLINLDITLFE